MVAWSTELEILDAMPGSATEHTVDVTGRGWSTGGKNTS